MDNVKINGSALLLSHFENQKSQLWVYDSEKIEECIKASGAWENSRGLHLSENKWGCYGFGLRKHKYALSSGISIDERGDIHFLSDTYNEYKFGKIYHELIIHKHKFRSLRDLKSLNIIENNILIVKVRNEQIKIKLSNDALTFINTFIENFKKEVEAKYSDILKKKETQKNNQLKAAEILKESRDSFVKKYDSDGNGIIDLVEGANELKLLMIKHQNKILAIDKDYVHKFVKLSNSMKQKREQIQEIFVQLSSSKNEFQFNKNISVFNLVTHSYELQLFHSLNMLVSLVEGDLITFFEIYEIFDKLSLFNNNWENMVAQKLNETVSALNEINADLKRIEGTLGQVLSKLGAMENSIVNGLNELKYTSQTGFQSLEMSVTKELESIDSSVKFNNLLTAVSAYQMYKVNKNTKGLR